MPNEVRRTGGSLPARHRPARSGASLRRSRQKPQEEERDSSGGGVEREEEKCWNGGGCVPVPSWFGRWFGTRMRMKFRREQKQEGRPRERSDTEVPVVCPLRSQSGYRGLLRSWCADEAIRPRAEGVIAGSRGPELGRRR